MVRRIGRSPSSVNFHKLWPGWNECTLEPFVVFAILIIAGALVAARLCVAGVVRFAEWHGAANAKRLLARHRVALVVGFSWGG